MRIVVFTTWFPDDASPSTAPFNLNHVKAIAAAHEVRVIHVRLGGAGGTVNGEYEGVPVTRVPLSPTKPWGYFSVIRALSSALRDADILHTMAFTSAAVAAPINVFCNKPWVHTEHWSGISNPDSVSKNWVLFSWLRFILRLPHAVTAVSEAQSAVLVRFARRGAVSVVPNVVAVPRVLTPRTPNGSKRLKLIAVGSLNPGKRPSLAVEALRLLRVQGHDASLTWVGDGPLRDAVQAQVEQARLSPQVTITGLVPPSKVAEELSKADLFILPTAHETFCMAAAEAVAAGLPAVVTDLPAVRDFLTNENSVLVTGSNAADYAAGVDLARSRFSQVSAETISATMSSRFSPARICAEFSEVYAFVGSARQ